MRTMFQVMPRDLQRTGITLEPFYHRIHRTNLQITLLFQIKQRATYMCPALTPAANPICRLATKRRGRLYSKTEAGGGAFGRSGRPYAARQRPVVSCLPYAMHRRFSWPLDIQRLLAAVAQPRDPELSTQARWA
mmetsp:Transcript_15060/g.46783  ORF Transcript_15060/g.46783 Transcript_15060/m.46783 type:complete len:134 (+) Transcript_15060:195-596(+)